MIDRLLERTGINDTDSNGCTAMHYSVRHMNQIDATRYLISRGADVTVVNHKVNTPLHDVMGGRMTGTLNENGNFNQPPDSPIKAREELVTLLVNAGGSMDVPSGAGKTPTQLLDELEKRQQI
ncbi:ankyrin [Penicillium odoratum]|uniref:ankyrin n=1 Tax=Penicillium odoratum TaxID=1167516 RepID=UPI00254790C0|nr:ankyrin [Penicillium odoratum]KAJ5752201.1 ankyrin [Penicillium odoratum]